MGMCKIGCVHLKMNVLLSGVMLQTVIAKLCNAHKSTCLDAPSYDFGRKCRFVFMSMFKNIRFSPHVFPYLNQSIFRFLHIWVCPHMFAFTKSGSKNWICLKVGALTVNRTLQLRWCLNIGVDQHRSFLSVLLQLISRKLRTQCDSIMNSDIGVYIRIRTVPTITVTYNMLGQIYNAIHMAQYCRVRSGAVWTMAL